MTERREITSNSLSLFSDVPRRTSYKPEITYRFNHRGTEYTGRRLTFGSLTTARTEAESLVERFAVGTRWEVRICEARPQLSVLHPGVTSRLWSSLVFFVVFSIGSVGVLISVVATLKHLDIKSNGSQPSGKRLGE